MNLLFVLLSFACSRPEQGCQILDPPGYVMLSTATFVMCVLLLLLLLIIIKGYFRMLSRPYTGIFTRAVQEPGVNTGRVPLSK